MFIVSSLALWCRRELMSNLISLLDPDIIQWKNVLLACYTASSIGRTLAILRIPRSHIAVSTGKCIKCYPQSIFSAVLGVYFGALWWSIFGWFDVFFLGEETANRGKTDNNNGWKRNISQLSSSRRLFLRNNLPIVVSMADHM